MHDSTEWVERLQLPETGFVFEVGSLYDRLEGLVDGRHARGRRYPLALLVLLMILGKLSGEDRPEGIAAWARQRLPELIELLPLERATLPCANTYRNVVRDAIEPQPLQQLFSDYLLSQPGAGQSVLVCIDGKTLRGTLNARSSTAVQLLAAYLPAEGLVLMQVAVAPKSNEMTAAPQVLKSLDLRGKVVMGDALHTQRNLSLQIVAAGGEYLWYAKDNQPTLRADIERLFTPEVCGPGSSPLPTDFESSRQVTKGHGRLEVRTLTSSRWLTGYLDWPQLGQVFKLERQVRTLPNPQSRTETVYGLTSLTRAEASPARLLELTRQYWGIENGLHYRRDVTLQEDGTRLGETRAAQVWASLNNLLVGLLKPLGLAYLPQARRCFNADLLRAVDTLTRRTL